MGDHYLQPNHKSETPSRIICLDTESWTKNPDHVQRLRLGNAVYLHKQNGRWGEESFDFHTVKEFHDWLDGIFSKEKKVRIWMISHNMAYDFPVLEMDRYLSRDGWESPKLFVPGSPFLYFTKKHYSQKDTIDLRIVSTTNWYNWPLAKLAPVFGTFKMEIPYADLGLKKDDFDGVSDDVLLPYCRQDTRVVVAITKGHIDFIRDNDLGTVQPTIASQAFSAFRHRFMPRDTPLLVHHRPNLIQMELEAYKGGRTEAFQLGKVDDVYILDVNSMYPSVMHTNPYPVVPKCKSPVVVNSGYVPSSWENDFLIARCHIRLKEPCLGVHRESDHKLVFPVGNIKTTLTGPEISYLEDNPDLGEVSSILQLAAYEWTEHLFTAYIDFFYDLKKYSKNPVTTQEAKLFLNSLYGKFGQRMHGEITEATDEDIGAIFAMRDNKSSVLYDKDRTYIQSGDRVLVKSKDNNGEVSHNAMPRIAAAVTAYARLSLWEVIQTAGLERVYYCDTDSIMTDEEGLRRCMQAGLCDESRLGALKWEGPYELDFMSPKHYGVNRYHWKNKGIRKNAKQLSPNSWEQDSFKTGMSRYRDGTMDGVKVEKIIKTCQDINDKGTVTKSGRVIPLVFDDF